MHQEIETRYFLDGKLHASRLRPYAPAVGDEIRLKSGIYVVTFRIWIEDSEISMHNFHCAVNIEPIKQEKQNDNNSQKRKLNSKRNRETDK